MEFHPSQIPIAKMFEINSEDEAITAAAEMVKGGFSTQKNGYKVLMPKEATLAKRIGYLLVNELNYGLRKAKQERNVQYWIYHHDKSHYALVLINYSAFQDLSL